MPYPRPNPLPEAPPTEPFAFRNLEVFPQQADRPNEFQRLDVCRNGLAFAHVSRRTEEHPTPSPGWWVWLEEDMCLMRDSAHEVAYFRTYAEALAALPND